MSLHLEFNKLVDIKKLKGQMTLGAIFSPLLNVEQTFRVPLFFDKKERSAMMPKCLFMAMKAKVALDGDMVLVEDDKRIQKDTFRILRDVMIDIEYVAGDDGEGDVSLSKTFQEKIFRHLVWGEPLGINPKKDLVRSVSEDKAHTVTMRKTPSFTIPSYLCRWVLEKDGLNPKTPFSEVNSYLKLTAEDVYEQLSPYPIKDWRKIASFSRRVQNTIIKHALEQSTNVPENFLETSINIPK